MKHRLHPYFLTLVFLTGSSMALAEKSELNLSSNYAQTVWPSGHRDPENTDYVPLVMSRKNRIVKPLLEGHPIFWPPIAGPDGVYYVSSGKGPGHSNLHALNSDGDLLWKSPPQSTLDDLDSYAIINAPIVDRFGDVYVGDRNQLWAFHEDGTLKWVRGLEEYGIDYGFMSAVLSKQGYVGGISSNGKVVFFRSESGELAMPVLDLPGGAGPPAGDTPPRDLWKDLMDPAIKDFMFKLIQGWEMEVANTPARDSRTGRIFITAAGVEPGTGLLYGIDVFDDRLEIAFQTPMGGGSGTSPAVSHDGKQVYALDEAGRMIAVSAETGAVLWKTGEGGGGSASPSVGADGTVYSANQDHLLAFRPDGTPLWEMNYNAFSAEHLPELGWFGSLFFSEPVAFVDSLFVVGDREGWLDIVCGYHLKLLPSGSSRTRVPVPLRSFVVAIDLESGEPIGTPLEIPETSEGFITPTLDGNRFVTHSGAISSIFYHMLNPILPEHLEVPNEPKAGLLLLEPESYFDLALEGQARLRRLLQEGVTIPELQRGSLQAKSTAAVLEKAYARGEISAKAFELHQARLAETLKALQAFPAPN